MLGAHVVLDSGHGEPGAVGPTGLREADLNLDIARRVRTLLEAEGATVVLTRDADVRMTLATRAAIAKTMDAGAFVSVHHDAAPSAVRRSRAASCTTSSPTRSPGAWPASCGRRCRSTSVPSAPTRPSATTPAPGSGFKPTKEIQVPAGSGGDGSGCVDPPLA